MFGQLPRHCPRTLLQTAFFHPTPLTIAPRNFMEVKNPHIKAKAGFCSLTPTIHRPWMNTVVPWMNTVVDWTGGCLECLLGCNDFVHNTACTWRIIQPMATAQQSLLPIGCVISNTRLDTHTHRSDRWSSNIPRTQKMETSTGTKP